MWDKLCCPVCSQEVYARYLSDHLVAHHDHMHCRLLGAPCKSENWKCYVCGFECWEFRTMHDHLDSHSGREIEKAVALYIMGGGQ